MRLHLLQENRVEMAVMLLSLFVVTVIQLTSSQSTYDVIQQDSDVDSCEGTQQVLSQLVTAVSQLQKDIRACNENKDTHARAKGTLKITTIKTANKQFQ